MHRLLTLLVSSWLLAGTSVSQAQGTSAVVLGIRSVEGDDDVAHDMTQALRTAAKSKTSWALSPREVSMSQMALANGCEEIDATCLAAIAKSLEVSRVVYGTVRRTSAQSDYDFELTVSVFNAETGSIARTLNETIPKDEASFQGVASRAERIISRLATAGEEGAIVVSATVAGADVRLDGESVGQTSQEPLRLAGVSAGEHTVEVVATGHAPHQTRVTVETGSDVTVDAQLVALVPQAPAPVPVAPADDEGGDLQWLGWTLVGVGAASLIGAGASMIIVGGVDDDDLFKEYKERIAAYNDRVGPGPRLVDDVCEEAERGLPHGLSAGELANVADTCSSADTFEVLQWVFLGTAVAAGGAGAIILLTDDSGDEAAGTGARLALRPTFDGQGAGWSATLRF